jgi:hypothetical protein
MQCLAAVLYGKEGESLSQSNVSFLVKAYTPFVVIPLIMLVDMSIRCMSLISVASQQQEIKSKKQ